MLSQPLRCISKTRYFLSPRRCCSTTSSSYITPFKETPANPSGIRHGVQNPSLGSREIVSSFKNWFRTSQNPTFDLIFKVLDTKNEDELVNLDLGFSHLGLRLTEPLVLEILRYKRSDVLTCLKFFDWAGRQRGFWHTRATYISLFKILARAKLDSVMLDLINTYGKTKLMEAVRFDDMLVMGYAFAGKVDVALMVFGKVRWRGTDLNPVAYHVLLNALVEGGNFDAVKVVLEQIKLRGIEGNATRSIVVKSLCKQGRLEEAEEYFRNMVGQSAVLSGNLFGVIVDGLCKQKMFLRAGELIQEFGERGDVPMDVAYGAWIRDLVQAGELDAALEFFNSKKSLEGFIPKVNRFNALIIKLLGEDRLQEVCDLLMDMKECRIAPDKMTMNAALCFFCKAGMMDVAIELYKGSSEFGIAPHGSVYNYIVNTLCADGNTDEAYQVLKDSISQGNFPGSRTFSILVDALCREGKLDKMRDLIMFSLERKFVPKKFTYEKFIRALCRVSRVEDGYLIHGELSRLNKTTSLKTYTYLISGFTKAGRGDLAGRLLIEMQEKGHKPTPSLFKAVIHSVCRMEDDKYYLQLLEMQLTRFGHNQETYSYFVYGAGHARKPELGRAVFEMMEKAGLFPSLNSDIFMLQCFLKSDRIGDAMNFFVDIPRRRKLGRKLYNTMVVGLCKAGKADYASAILSEARNSGQTPGLECYEELIKLYCLESKFDQAIVIINELQKAGRPVSSFVGNCLLLYSLHSGDVYQAWLRSKDGSLETPAIATLGKLIATFSDQIRVDSKVEDLEELILMCFRADLFTYNMLLRKLSMDHIDKACQLFKRMCHKGLKPNRWTYDILVRGLFKHGRIAEGNIWAEEMHRRGYHPSESNWMFS